MACHGALDSTFQPCAVPSVTITTNRLVASGGASERTAACTHAGMSAAASVGLRPESRSRTCCFVAGSLPAFPASHWGTEAATISRTRSPESRRSSVSRVFSRILSKTGTPPCSRPVDSELSTMKITSRPGAFPVSKPERSCGRANARTTAAIASVRTINKRISLRCQIRRLLGTLSSRSCIAPHRTTCRRRRWSK